MEGDKRSIQGSKETEQGQLVPNSAHDFHTNNQKQAHAGDEEFAIGRSTTVSRQKLEPVYVGVSLTFPALVLYSLCFSA